MTRFGYALLSLVVLATDLFTKWLVLKNFAIHESKTVIPGLFQLVHVRNPGAAFGIGANSDSALVPLLLNGGAIAVFFIVVAYSLRTAVTERVLQLGLHLILAGAIGNLIDRFRLGSVVDFLDFYVSSGGREHHWPAFNVADSAICIGVGLLFLDMWRKPEPSATPVRS
ncbi:MAG TPA: signal peptidase II [Thermoanaerobaculia bacterium]|nr:signal peptidase II [Thermoanaerobaculia bacterium]